jgi:hypothetical protein
VRESVEVYERPGRPILASSKKTDGGIDWYWFQIYTGRKFY